MIPERLRELKFQVRRHMNGEVAQIMKGLDDSYKANYGISIQHARDVAEAEDLSAADCSELWATGWRDLMLIAAAAMGRHNPPAEVIAQWAASVPTVEMADALPFLLAGRMGRVVPLAAMLMTRDEGFDFAIAANFIGRAIVARQAPEFSSAAGREAAPDGFIAWKDGMSPVVSMAACVLLLAASRPSWTFAETRSVSFLARQCCRLRRYGEAFDFCSRKALDVVKASATVREAAEARAVADDIEAEIEMLNA